LENPSLFTGIFDFANLIFQTASYFTGEKSRSNLEKNPAGYFKLENWKNQVQIDRGIDLIMRRVVATEFFQVTKGSTMRINPESNKIYGSQSK
jgi:hypothetical protein